MLPAPTEENAHKRFRPNASSVNELAPAPPPPASVPKAVVPPSPFLPPVLLPPKPAALPLKPTTSGESASGRHPETPELGKKARAKAARAAAALEATSSPKAPAQSQVEVELRARLARMAAARASAALPAIRPSTPPVVVEKKEEPTLVPVVAPPQPETVAGPPEVDTRATTSNKVSAVISALVTAKLDTDVLGPLLGLLTSILVDTLDFEKARDRANVKVVPEEVAPLVVVQEPSLISAVVPPILSESQLASIDKMDDNFASVLKLLRNLGRHIVARQVATDAGPLPTSGVVPSTGSVPQEPGTTSTLAQIITVVPASKAVAAAAQEPEHASTPIHTPTPVVLPVPAPKAVVAAAIEPELERTPVPNILKRLSIPMSSSPIVPSPVVPTFALNAIAPTPRKPTAQALLADESDDCVIVDSSPVKPRIPPIDSSPLPLTHQAPTHSPIVIDEIPRILKRPRSQSPDLPRAQSPIRGTIQLPRRLPSPPTPPPIAHRLDPLHLPTAPRQTSQLPTQRYQPLQRSYSSSFGEPGFNQALPSRPSFPPSSRSPSQQYTSTSNHSNNNNNSSSSTYPRPYDNRYDPYEREVPRRLDDRLGPPAVERRYLNGGGYYDPRDSRSRSPDRERRGRSQSRSR